MNPPSHPTPADSFGGCSVAPFRKPARAGVTAFLPSARPPSSGRHDNGDRGLAEGARPEERVEHLRRVRGAPEPLRLRTRWSRVSPRRQSRQQGGAPPRRAGDGRRNRRGRSAAPGTSCGSAARTWGSRTAPPAAALRPGPAPGPGAARQALRPQSHKRAQASTLITSAGGSHARASPGKRYE